MLQSSRRTFSPVIAIIVACACLFVAAQSRVFAQAGSRSYELLSESPTEVVIRVSPEYQFNDVIAKDGRIYSEVRFAGGTIMDSIGAPEAQKLILPLLAPNRTPATVEVIDQKLDVRANIDLAPVPSYIRKPNGGFAPVFDVLPEKYLAQRSSQPFELEAAALVRTAYVQKLIVSPIAYDPISRSLTLVRSMTLRIKFNGAIPKAVDLPKTEASFFQTIFLNGATREYYRAAMVEIEPHRALSKNAKSLSASSAQWLMVETSDEGVYRISASDLRSMGITGAIDASSVELFGVGGATLSETVTSQSGEWIECPIELHQNGSDFSDLYFYASGVTQWKYSREYGMKSDGVFHTINPYADRGHFLLKIGGDRLAPAARIVDAQDSVTGTALAPGYVMTAMTHEVESQMENAINAGHELLGEKITRSDVGPLSFTMVPPGYLPDSSTVHVAFNASLVNASGSVSLSVNGQHISDLPGHTSRHDNIYADPEVYRNWDNTSRVPANASSPLHIDLSFTSDGPTAYAKLNFVELIYRRSLAIGGTTISFFVADTLETSRPMTYNFQQATGGQVWEVTTATAPKRIASASGDALTATIQRIPFRMRNFVAFSAASLKTPSLTRISAPTLRETVGTAGAVEIILTPGALMAEANAFKQVREQGGDATEPMSVAVVNIDSVFREFGYGAKDVTAIRDFMAYTFRHGATKVHYLLLFGSGHCDYLNRATSIPNFVAPYEVTPFSSLSTYRTNVPSDPYPYPDDGYFVRLDSANTIFGGKILDAAVGRVSANNADEAEAFVTKTRHYEHASDTGVWRGITTFQADDRIGDLNDHDCDGINHLGDSESEETEVPKRLQIHKLYDVSYPRIQTSSGVHQPDVEEAIVSAINDGSVMYSFVGHGNPNVWTHEGVLGVPNTINRFDNYDRLTYFTTATCDFSEYDNFAAAHSGGIRLLLKADGGAIGLLGTSRSVTGGDNLPNGFYDGFLNVRPESGLGSGSAGDALIAGKAVCSSYNLPIYYLLGDPAQRLLIPKRIVAFDSIQGATVQAGSYQLPALAQTKITGHIEHGDGTQLLSDDRFNGTITVTLFDARVQQRATTVCPGTNRIVKDAYWVDGPILYRGTATVKDGRFSVSFVVPKDVRLDTMNAKLSGYAYGEGKSALGVEEHLRLMPPAPDANVSDTNGPALNLYIGSRNFRSGDAVSKHTTAIVDVDAIHGLNTSTASVGHSFIVWVDDAQDSSFDMAQTYISKQDDFTSGSSMRRVELPAGRHILHARAFDAYNNPSFASVEFVAKNEDPYRLYDVVTHPNPVFDHTTFSFTQPAGSGSLVEITLAIYTTDARLERTITLQTRESTIDIPWDGRDDAGNTVANGVHVFTINARNLDDGTSTMASGKCVVAR